MITDIETPLIAKIIEIAANNEASQTTCDDRGKGSMLRIEVVTPEQNTGPGGGRYTINITDTAAKELAGRITKYFESKSL